MPPSLGRSERPGAPRPRCLVFRFLLFALLLTSLALLSACTAASVPPLPTPLPTPAVRLTPPPAPNGLLLVVVDGVRAMDVEAWRDEGALPALERLAARGHVEPLVPVEPTLPEIALASLLAGEAQDSSVLLGEVGPPPLTPFWVGLPAVRTALVGTWPGADPTWADVGVLPGAPTLDSALHEPVLVPARGWVAAPASFSPRLEAELPLRRAGQPMESLFLLAVDTLNDGQATYDQLWLAPTRHIGPDAARLDALDPGWTTLDLDPYGRLDLRLLSGPAEPLRLYQSPARPLHRWPARALPSLVDLGGYPPDPDLVAYERGWLGLDEVREMAARQNAWLAEVAAGLWETTPPGARPVVALRWAAVGALQRAWLLADPAQPAWEAARQATLLDARRRAMADADATLARLLSRVDGSRHTVVVTSPLGAEPLRQTIYLPRLLDEAGLDAAAFDVRVAGGVAWLRPAPGEPDGTLDPVRAALARARDPTNEQPLFARLLRGAEAGDWLYVQARAGYDLSAERGPALLAPATQLGGSGGPAESPHLSGWWLVAGPAEVPQRETSARPLPQVVAELAARLRGGE